MKLNKAIGKGGFIYAERYLNEGTKTYSPFSADADMDRQYWPTAKTAAIDVPYFVVPKSEVKIYSNNPSQNLADFYINRNEVLLPVHPQLAAEPGDIPHLRELVGHSAGTISAIPTASFRTLLTTASTPVPHFLKLHYPRRISRMIRRVQGFTVAVQLAVSAELGKVDSPGFGYLPETLGVTLGHDPDSWGFLIREYQVKPQGEPLHLVPLFALYGQDLNSLDDPPLLAQLIRHHSADPVRFTHEHIVEPLITGWCRTVKQTGILLASHGQNTLVGLDDALVPRRIVHRDFCTDVDARIRRLNAQHLGFPERYLFDDSSLNPPERLYSLIYDSYLGHHTLEYLAKTIEEHFGADADKLRSLGRDTFRREFPDHEAFFPRSVYYYSDRILPQNRFELVDTGQRPLWR